jgi:hypothetical protein
MMSDENCVGLEGTSSRKKGAEGGTMTRQILRADARRSVKFLQRLGLRRPLVAIKSEGGRIVGFMPTTPQATAAWIERSNADAGIYFHVNRTRRPMNGKAGKDDMAWADFVHVELDPAAHVKDLDAWHRELRHIVINSIWPPTWIWRSGNGIQALWQFKHPVRVLGDPEAVAHVEAVNRYFLSHYAGGDVEVQGTHDICRILRVPYTINWPNKSKRKAGRLPILAGAVHHNPGAIYELADLPALESVVAQASPVPQIGDAESVADLDDLLIPGWLKQLVLDGRVGKRKPVDNSRSIYEWQAICSLIRHRVPLETILGILLDGRFAISERCLEQEDRGRDPEEYARRTIGRARASITADLHAQFPNMLREPRPLKELMEKVFK